MCLYSEEIQNSKRCMENKEINNRIRGSLIGGAIGDALGYPVEFLSWSNIKNKYGATGITRYDR